MLQKMKKVQVIGPKKDLQHVVDVLYHSGTVHLEDVSKTILPGDTLLRRMDTEKLGDIANILVKIGGIFLALPKIKDDPLKQAQICDTLLKKSHQELVAEANRVIEELESTTKNFAINKSNLEFDLNRLAKTEKIVERIRPLESQIPVLEGFEITFLIVQREFRDALEHLRNALIEITRNQFEMQSEPGDEETLISIIIFNRKYSEQVHSYLFAQNINEVRMPQEFEGKPFSQVLQSNRGETKERF